MEQRILEAFVVNDGTQETLVGHVAVVRTRDAERRHHSLHQAIPIIDFLFHVALFIGGIAPGKTFLHRQVRIRVEEQGDTLIARIHDRNLLHGLLVGYSRSFIEQEPHLAQLAICAVPSPANTGGAEDNPPIPLHLEAVRL